MGKKSIAKDSNRNEITLIPKPKFPVVSLNILVILLQSEINNYLIFYRHYFKGPIVLLFDKVSICMF